MNDPSVTQTLEAAEQQHGSLMLVLAFLRRYWGRVLTGVAAIFVCGQFFNKFEALEKGQIDQIAAIKAQGEHIQRQEGHLQAIDANIVAIRDAQAKRDADWESIHAAADIVIKPRGKGVK